MPSKFADVHAGMAPFCWLGGKVVDARWLRGGGAWRDSQWAAVRPTAVASVVAAGAHLASPVRGGAGTEDKTAFSPLRSRKRVS